jgi:hypothetical protein
MAKFGKCDFEQLKELQKKMEKLEGNDFNAFCESCAKELTARLLRKVIKRTPVGEYKEGSGKNGGTLRRGWTSKTEAEAHSGKSDVMGFVDKIAITKKGSTYQVEIINPVEYASYVEYGHRTRNHKGWVKGKFMLTISEQELQTQAPKILEKKLMQYLGECFNA